MILITWYWCDQYQMTSTRRCHCFCIIMRLTIVIQIDVNNYHCCCLLRANQKNIVDTVCTSTIVTSSRGVDSVDIRYAVYSAVRSLVVPRAQQPKELVTLVFRTCARIRTPTFFERKTRAFTREIARIGISTFVSGTHNPQRTSNG